MAQTCDACGKAATRWSLAADGAWAGRVVCRDCRRQVVGLKRVAWTTTFQFRLAKVLPADDPLTVPVLRLLMAVGDVRRAQLHLVEAHQRLEDGPASERYLALGDFLYALRRLLSHLHEAGIAVRHLDTKAKKRVDALLAGNDAAGKALKAVRKYFNAGDYDKSLVSKVRNAIGFHYDNDDVEALVKAELTDDVLLESTVSEVGGLARIADPLVRQMMFALNGGDFLSNDDQTIQISQALDRRRRPVSRAMAPRRVFSN